MKRVTAMPHHQPGWLMKSLCFCRKNRMQYVRDGLVSSMKTSLLSDPMVWSHSCMFCWLGSWHSWFTMTSSVCLWLISMVNFDIYAVFRINLHLFVQCYQWVDTGPEHYVNLLPFFSLIAQVIIWCLDALLLITSGTWSFCYRWK